MRKKMIIGGIVCCCIGILALTLSLPMAVKDNAHLYNELVSGDPPPARETVLEEPVTELKLILSGMRHTLGNMVEVIQSPDDKIHIFDTSGDSYEIASQVVDGKAVVILKENKKNNILLKKETIRRNLLRLSSNRYGIELAVPQTVTITSQEADSLHFVLNSSVEFVNAEEIRTYSYQPNAEDTLHQRMGELQEEVSRLKAENDQQIAELEFLREQLSLEQFDWHDLDEADDEENMIVYGNESTVNANETGQSVNNWSDIIREEENRIREAKRRYQEEEITAKQYWETADPAFQRLRTIRLREARLTTTGKSKQEAVERDVATLCGLQAEKNEIEIMEINAMQQLSSGILQEGDYTTNMMLLAKDKIQLQKEILALTSNLADMGYQWVKSK